MAQVPQTFFDALAVRAWCGHALGALGRAREEIDAINVYPVADGDTGTNLYLTVESAAGAVEAVFAGYELGEEVPTLADAAHAMAHGALIGARGNSGTILAQLLRGMAQVLTEGEATHIDGEGLRLALRHAADSARQAVAHPVEGTVLSVAAAAAAAADGTGGDCGTVARAAYEGACKALAATPGQLAVLERAGVVDAGGRGLVAVLGALVEAFTGETPAPFDGRAHGTGQDVHARVDPVSDARAGTCAEAAAGPAFEVVYLLEAEEAAVDRGRPRLDALGDSLVVVGGDGLWNVHVHV
ncbi:DAK2 domain-containing protein, partial [Streptomyces sp. NPDC127079]|uniref:DAK2 domain-containing protein n=1 Tax=Streptomyces sp. NPDC127079 TaxID=3347132 RepID=UPI003660D3A5